VPAEGDLEVVGEYGDGNSALEAVRSLRPQLLFLDIQMDPLNGIDVARALDPIEPPSLVFVTAYDHYALEAFEVCAVDYLLKPFDQERFRKTLSRVRPRHAHGAPPTAAPCSPVCWRSWSAIPARIRKTGRACSPS